jgi:hypothetical protein
MTAMMWVAVIYIALRMHSTGFGSYRHLLVTYALLNLTTQIVSILGIVIAMVTGTQNILSAPEFSFGTGNVTHLVMHLTVGMIAGTLVPWAIGSLIFTIARKLAPAPSRAEV